MVQVLEEPSLETLEHIESVITKYKEYVNPGVAHEGRFYA